MIDFTKEEKKRAETVGTEADAEAETESETEAEADVVRDSEFDSESDEPGTTSVRLPNSDESEGGKSSETAEVPSDLQQPEVAASDEATDLDQSDVETKTDADTEADADTEVEAEAEAEADTETVSDTEADADTDTEAETEAEAVESDLKWYTLQVFTGQEEKVKKYIEIEAARLDLAEEIINVHIPTQNVVEVRGGKKKVTTRVNFPGYMFVQMAITKNTRHFVRNAPSVMGFVGPDGEPVPLTEIEVHRIIGRGDTEATLPDVQFTVGQRVKVIDGPFMDFEGIVQECQPERKRLKVLVSIFGRNTPLDLAFFQVTATEEE